MALSNRKILVGFGLVGIGLASVVYVGSARWNEKTAQLVDSLLKEQSPNTQPEVDFRELELLPTPVARYFRATLKEGQPIIHWVRILQVGKFRVRGKDGAWSPFEATQHFLAQQPGFVWDADLRMNGLARVRVRDAYIKGLGSMQAKIFALVPVVDAHGEAKLNAGALQRYLAEAVWFPTALLPRHYFLARAFNGEESITIGQRQLCPTQTLPCLWSSASAIPGKSPAFIRRAATVR